MYGIPLARPLNVFDCFLRGEILPGHRCEHHGLGHLSYPSLEKQLLVRHGAEA